MTHEVLYTPTAEQMLKEIRDRRVQAKILDTGDKLAEDPEKQGNALLESLIGYRSLRAVGQRYRLIYYVDREQRRVWIVAVGIRKEGSKGDVYALAQKLLRKGLLEPPE